jgi:hypothetical protein
MPHLLRIRGIAPHCEDTMATDLEENGGTSRLLRRKEAAQYVTATYGFPCSPNTLAKLACVSSDGPPFRMAGRIPLYPQHGLDAWARSKIGPLVRSTSEHARHAA